MPKRTDLQSIFILGSGPIVIGQAAEQYPWSPRGTDDAPARSPAACGRSIGSPPGFASGSPPRPLGLGHGMRYAS